MRYFLTYISHTYGTVKPPCRAAIIIETSETVNNSSIKWERSPFAVIYCLRKSLIYQVLPFIVSQVTSPIGHKVLDREFYLSADYEFYSTLVIWNCKSVRSPDKFVKKVMLKCKNERFFFLKKKSSFTEGFFSKRAKI